MSEELLASWNRLFTERSENLPEGDKKALADQLAQVDWSQLAALVQEHVLSKKEVQSHFDITRIKPADFVPIASTEIEMKARLEAAGLGQALLSQGEVGVMIVAGGQGSRLGFDGPKGTYPIGSITGFSLFYFHARKVLALSRRYGRPVPLLIMTSPENDQATRIHFEEHGFFGLDSAQVRFFRQGQMPAVDRHTGEPIFAEPGQLALSPDGHGGALYALARTDAVDRLSALDWVESHGVKTLFYYQVDNPMVVVADPYFLGIHAENQAEVSFKIVARQSPEEKVGVVCVDEMGLKSVIEYSDLPPQLAQERDSAGLLAYRAGSIAVHLFQTSFLRRLASGTTRLPFHKALKKVPYWNFARNEQVSPDQPNAIKFEAFIFDTLPMAGRSVIVETDRTAEFEPLKNAEGPDSPDTVRAAMSLAAAKLLLQNGYEVEFDSSGRPLQTIELDPVLADRPDLIRQKYPNGVGSGPFVLIRD